jgi:hypothetical protein
MSHIHIIWSMQQSPCLCLIKHPNTPTNEHQARILFHCAHRRGDEGALMARHQELSEGPEDELSLASVHYQRGHYQEAIGAWGLGERSGVD